MRAGADWRSYYHGAERISMTLAQLAGEHLSVLEATHSPSLRDYRTTYAMVVEAFGGIDARELDAPMVEAWLEALSTELAPKTASKHLSLLSSLMGYARRRGAVEQNVTRLVEHRPGRRLLDPLRSALEVLSPEESWRMRSCASIPVWRRAAWWIALLTGVRSEELAGLEWRDVNDAAHPLGALRVERQWDPREKQTRATKTDHARIVPIHPQLARFIRDELSPWWSDHFRRDPRPGDPLCALPKHGRVAARWCDKTLRSWWHKDHARAGVAEPPSGPRRFHATRHTLDTLLVRAGADRGVVRALTHLTPLDEGAFGGYVHVDYPSLCAAILKYPIR